MDFHFLLQGIFPTQGSNPGLPRCRQALYHLSHQGSPLKLIKSPSFGFVSPLALSYGVHCFPGGSSVKNPPAVQEMQETRFRSLSWKDPLEKEMATLSSILSWEMPWTEEPGGLQSTGSQRVGHVLATKQQTICVQRTMQIL